MRLERDLGISVEIMAVFIRFWFSSRPALHEPAAHAARAKADERYELSSPRLGVVWRKGRSCGRKSAKIQRAMPSCLQRLYRGMAALVILET
jgi:hypothetical protein